MNAQLASRIVQQLKAWGVHEAVVCAGSRNSPLVAILRESGLQLYSHFEERSAGFFAFGRARALEAPVAVVTTSGTAAAELLPSCIEAHYLGVPLVLVTADRPKSYRGSGAPQSIEQAGLFGGYASASVDADRPEDMEGISWDGWSPMHINVCFEEPLKDAKTPALGLVRSSARTSGGRSPPPALRQAQGRFPHPLAASGPSQSRGFAVIADFLSSLKRPLVILGALHPCDRASVIAFLQGLGAQIHAEALSGLRESPELAPLLLRSGEKILSRGEFDGVIRIGGVPTTSFWRQLETKFASLPVLSLSSRPFSGLARESTFVHLPSCAGLDDLSSSSVRKKWTDDLIAFDREQATKLQSLYKDFPVAEPSLIQKLSGQMSTGSFVYLGNSLPIREWDLAAIHDHRGYEVVGNRGANGIDGQLSTFFGMCRRDREHWAIVGDLTALYDLAAPWILPQLSPMAINIAVINNGGGKIFERLYDDPIFQNRHNLNFRSWCEMWGMKYECWKGSHFKILPGPATIKCFEMVPDSNQTRCFWDRYDDLWSR